MIDRSGLHPHSFGALQAPPSRYNGMEQRGLYLPMRDGVRIAVEVYLPADIRETERIPTLLTQTRYWRDTELRAPLRWFLSYDAFIPKDHNSRRFFTSHGYAAVIVDVRGTGASFGVYTRPWSRESFEDSREIVDWIVRQPWSNGRVGAFGVSYGGTAAEYLALLNHPAVKVVIPKFNHPDAYLDISHPGGSFNQRFIRQWGVYDENLDLNRLPPEMGTGRIFTRGVKPVSADRDRGLLRQAVREHAANTNVYASVCQIVYRDECAAGSTYSANDIAVHTYRDLLEASSTQIVGWGSWMDAGTADAVLRRFLTFDRASLAVVGAWDHGGNHSASPFVPPETAVSPLMPRQFTEMLAVFDHFLVEGQPVPPTEKTLFYYTMGEEKWKTTSAWPPPGVRTERWTLGKDRALSPAAAAAEDGFDEYPVDFRATTGRYNVWWEMAVLEKKTVSYPDRAEQDKRLLCYTSTPLETDLEISGYPVVSLWVASTETDGAFFAYLEEVEPDGHVVYITEGHLRAIHRRISPEKPPYNIQVPYHTYREADALPLVPGETVELRFGLNPTSALVRKGCRLRLAIAGHDEGTFARVPETGAPVVRVGYGPNHPSALDLPVIRRPQP